MGTQKDFDKVIASMISGIDENGNSISAGDFDIKMLEDFKNQKEDFWKWILEYMKSTAPTIKQANLNDDGDNLGLGASVFGYINEQADLDRLTDFWSTIKNYYYSDASQLDETTTSGKKEITDKNYFWNESMSKAIVQFLLHFDLDTMIQKENEDLIEQGLERDTDYDVKETGKKIKFKNGIKVGDKDSVGHMHISDIINADAGFTFNNGPWVKPQYNVDGELYRNVRGADKILSVLKSSEHLQYTVSQDQNPHWLRLLMPEYLRYVEVEDLNRNFWVIGQTIAALSAYLFGDESPINDALKNLLNEIAQLWQNIMYLWVTAAALSRQEYYTTFHTEVVLLPNQSIEHYIKFDNFENSNEGLYSESDWVVNWEEIKSRLTYLVNSYSKQNLVLVPVIKTNNYKHNYYQTEIYPGIMIYNRNLDKWAIIQFNLKIDAADYQDRIYAIKENEETYDYYFPLATDISTLDKSKFFGMIYVDTNIGVPDNPEDTHLNYGFLSIQDRGSQILYNCDTSIGGYRQLDTFELGSVNFNYDEITYIQLTKTEKIGTPLDEEKINEIRSVDILKGFYLGELISFQKHTIYTVYNINTEESISVLPVLYNENVFNTLEFSNAYNSRNLEHFKIHNCTSVEKIMSEYINNGKPNQINARELSFKDYLTHNAAINALQWIYDIQHSYYEDDNGNYLVQKLYNYSEIIDLIKEKCGFTTEYIKNTIQTLYSSYVEILNHIYNDTFNYNENLSSQDIFDPLFIYWIKNKFIPYLQTLGDTFKLEPDKIGGNSLTDEEINQNKYFCSTFLLFLLSEKTASELNENMEGSIYRNHDYVSGAAVGSNSCPVSDYDELALELFGEKYLLETNKNINTFRFINTSRDAQTVHSIHSNSTAVIISTNEGKVLNGEILKRFQNKEIELSDLRADQYIIQGYYDQGSYRKGMLLVDPIEKNKKITSAYESYPYNRPEENGMYTGQLGYKDSKFIFNSAAAQPVHTETQFYVLTENGDNLTSNNWCLIRIDTNYFHQMSYYWGTGNGDYSTRTKFEYIGHNTNIIAPDVNINNIVNIMNNEEEIDKLIGDNTDINETKKLILEQVYLYKYYKFNGLNWPGKDEEGTPHFMNQRINFQCSIFCYRNDEKTARQIFVRDTCGGALHTEDANYLKWKLIIDKTTSNDETIDQLIQNYKVISNTHPGYNFAKYLSNGKYVPMLESGDLDDDNSHFNLQFEENAWQREEMN